MSRSINLFIKRTVPEREIVTRLNREIPDGIESLEYPKARAAVFLQYADHEAESSKAWDSPGRLMSLALTTYNWPSIWPIHCPQTSCWNLSTWLCLMATPGVSRR